MYGAEDLSCPYEQAYRIRNYTMPRHIRKCKPFDTACNTETICFEQRAAECSSKLRKDQYSSEYTEWAETKPLTKNQNIDMTTFDEDWDAVDYATYDPLQQTEKKDVLRCLIGVTKSTKKKFRVAERLRLQKLHQTNHSIDVSELKMLIRAAICAHEQTKALLHDSLFPEHTGIHKLSIHDTDKCLQKLNLHRLSFCDTNTHVKNVYSRNCEK